MWMMADNFLMRHERGGGRLCVRSIFRWSRTCDRRGLEDAMKFPLLPASTSGTVRRSFVVTLTLAIVGDLIFIALHLVRAMINDTAYRGFLLAPAWWLERDGGYSEIFQYVKCTLAVLLLLMMLVRWHALTYLGWSFGFLYMVVDDSLRLHETFGRQVGPWLESVGVMPAIGELGPEAFAGPLLVAAAGSLTLLLVVVGYRNRATRPLTRRLAVAAFGLFFCAVVLDAAHSAVGSQLGRATNFVLGTLEDGGELLAMSLALATVVSHAVACGSARPADPTAA